MDAVTALSGSGPAYVFLLAEALARAGAASGLPPDLAARLARATVAGSGELLHRSPLDPATLRQNVTSPGGTTAAALDVLMGPEGLNALMTRAVAAATAALAGTRGIAAPNTGHGTAPVAGLFSCQHKETTGAADHGPQTHTRPQRPASTSRSMAARRRRSNAADRRDRRCLHGAAGGKAFEEIGFAEIARRAGVSLAELRDKYASKIEILSAHMRATDRTVLAGIDESMAEEPPRERLFDVLMRRLDTLAPHKQAIRSLRRSALCNPASPWRSTGSRCARCNGC